MDKHTYIAGVSKLINECPYCSIPKDPSTSNLTKVKTAIKSSHILPMQLKKSLIPPITNCARLYALPKVHKTGIPFRPIVSNIRTASYPLAKYLVSRFSPLLANNIHTVKSSSEVTNKLKDISILHSIMVSFDVKSLFTNVPVEGALKCLETRLWEFHFTHTEIDELVSLTKV
ncbi:hypothetical protein X975_08034, partial [Stegodyphus mimosarum]